MSAWRHLWTSPSELPYILAEPAYL